MRYVDVQGWLFAWDIARQQPRLVEIEGTPWLPIYETEATLRQMMRTLKIAGFTIKQIDDPKDFIASVQEAGVRVCIDLRNEEGMVRFAELSPTGHAEHSAERVREK